MLLSLGRPSKHQLSIRRPFLLLIALAPNPSSTSQDLLSQQSTSSLLLCSHSSRPLPQRPPGHRRHLVLSSRDTSSHSSCSNRSCQTRMVMQVAFMVT